MAQPKENPEFQIVSPIVASSNEEYRAGGSIPAGDIYNVDRFAVINLPEDVNLNRSYSVGYFPEFIHTYVEGLDKLQARDLMYWGLQEGVIESEDVTGPKGREVKYLKVKDIYPLINNLEAWRSKDSESPVEIDGVESNDEGRAVARSNSKVKKSLVAFNLSKILGIPKDEARDFYHWALISENAPIETTYYVGGTFKSSIDEEGLVQLAELYEELKDREIIFRADDMEDGDMGVSGVIFDQEDSQEILAKIKRSGEKDPEKEYTGRFGGGVNLNSLSLKERLIYKTFVETHNSNNFGFPEVPERLRIAILQKWGEEELDNLQAEYGKTGGHDIDFKGELDRITVYAIRAIAFKRNPFPSKSRFQTNPHAYNSMILDSDLQIVRKELKVIKANNPDITLTLDDVFDSVMNSFADVDRDKG